MRAFAPVLGARGGGKADLAQGAGGDPANLPEAFAAAKKRGHRIVSDYSAMTEVSWMAGVDVGTVRVGVARSDPRGMLATPVITLARDPHGNRDIAELAALVRDSTR